MLTTIRSYTYETEVTNILKRYSDKKTDRQRERVRERERFPAIWSHLAHS